MLEIHKDKAPDFFKDWLKNNQEHGQLLKEFILEKEQQQVCCYCEKGITSLNDSHIEHIRPRDKFPQLKNNYQNLVVSCITPGRCGNAKGNKFNKHFIVPTEENPGEFLTYSPNGEIRAIDNNKKAAVTIEILNLNTPRLVGARRTLFIRLNNMKETFTDFQEFFKEYPTFIKYFKDYYLELPI
ncbi:MAG TPA: retron system putative HNH endonuclease [Candidatus Deferrimicrobium sp.]|nr:retron system putative HNH endonuclease [Candidatus Deferrimicrobium sp.]